MSARDLEHKQEASDELRESERRFSEMLSNVALISMMLDRQANIEYCNDYLLNLTGWRLEEVLGRSFLELFLPLDLHEELRGVYAAMLENSPAAWHHENDILTRSGERRLIRWNNSVLRSSSGAVMGVASIDEDVTVQKRAEMGVK
jgi:PAS domain S-box-containing protein